MADLMYRTPANVILATTAALWFGPARNACTPPAASRRAADESAHPRREKPTDLRLSMYRQAALVKLLALL
jgi:hypothetical protein